MTTGSRSTSRRSGSRTIRDAVELRPFGVYGPGEDYAIRFISNACCKALLGMPVTLRRDRLLQLRLGRGSRRGGASVRSVSVTAVWRPGPTT